MKNIIANNVGVWIATTIVALLTIFSDKILERIRFRLNRADLRTKYFEELAVDLSTYLFYSEIFHERYQKGWADDPEDLAAIGGAINGAITTLRKKEYVYRAWVRKYWGSAAVEQFAQVMAAVKSVDDAVHAFNDAGNEKEKTDELGKRLDKLRARVDEWLSQPGAQGKRFPSSRCASTIQIVRPSESTAETQPKLQLRFLRLSAIISQYFIRIGQSYQCVFPIFGVGSSSSSV